ncbi:insulin-like growth factor 1 receptor isoform X1 [Oscarella lobularis]|uniref:insulin-like growth factor 1 receptor isoform X1 n=1 Tax=Oscarella lobularis TaxID=121494 RepID=UPI003313E4B4
MEKQIKVIIEGYTLRVVLVVLLLWSTASGSENGETWGSGIGEMLTPIATSEDLGSVSEEAPTPTSTSIEAKTVADCGQTNVGPSSNPCQFLILTPIATPGQQDKEGDGIMTIVISISVSVAVLLLIVLVIVVVCVRRRRQAKLEVIQLQVLQNQRRSLYDDAHWLMTWPSYDDFQFSRDCLKMEDELGEGQFGKVYSAWAARIVKGEEKTRVAVKTMKRGSSLETAEDFRKEMEIMMDFDHPNIVRLLGICTHDEPLYLITELMKHGDLKDYIRKARPNEINPRPLLLSIAQLVDVAAQAASGVAYLASRKFVHRDIAARNCLVGENDTQLSVKISDFGMARDVYQQEYYRRSGGALPIRWMAPEAITDGKYTVESDIWSLGVLLWEIFTFGYQPYFGRDNEQVIGGILQGNLTLECPPLCPRPVFQLMLRCWERNPSERITSGDVASALQDMKDLCDDDSEGAYDLSLDQKYVSRKKVAAEPSNASPRNFNMTSPQSQPPVQEDYTPMSPATPSGTKLDPMFEEEALLPQSKGAYLDMNGGDVRSVPSGQKPNTYVEIPQKEPEKVTKKKKLLAQDPVYADVSTDDLDLHDDPLYTSIPAS